MAVNENNGLPKLVRNKTPEMLASSGFLVSFRGVKNDELRKYVKEKLLEETLEFVNAEKKADLIEELADIYTVIDLILDAMGLACAEIEAAIEKKRREKGDFSNGYLLMSYEEVPVSDDLEVSYFPGNVSVRPYDDIVSQEYEPHLDRTKVVRRKAKDE